MKPLVSDSCLLWRRGDPAPSRRPEVRPSPGSRRDVACNVSTGLLALLLLVAGAAPAALRVDADNAAGPWDGASWATAHRYLQDALAVAATNGATEIWVAEGTYKPTTGTSRFAWFLLRSNVAVYGGFAGTETNLSQRNWIAHPTVLSGDIGAVGVATDNCYHVVACVSNTVGAALDGFTIRDGYANGPNHGTGGGGGNSTTPDAVMSGINHGTGAGLLNFRAAAWVRHCVFTNHYAGKGGGSYNMCSTNIGGSAQNPVPVFEDVTFGGNHATARGGGVSDDTWTHPRFVNCRFLGNTCDAKGGGLYNDFSCSPSFTNCLFAGNYALQAAALGNDGSSSPLLVNCVFFDNEAWDQGAAVYNGSHGFGAPGNNPVLINCVLWSNRVTTAGPADFTTWHDNDPQAAHSIVESGWPGAGNLTNHPLLDAYFRPGAGSPCVDAGTNVAGLASDLDGAPRPLDGDDDGTARADLGVFEFVSATADSDGDGLPDAWELAHGFAVLTNSPAAGDSDGDQQSDAAEAIADTNPHDGDSQFVVISLVASNGLAEVGFPSSSNRLYTLERSEDLPGAAWSVVTGQVDMAGSGAVMRLVDAGATAVLHRVRVRVP